VNTDVDIEAFDNLAYGSPLMDELASCMGGNGKYVAFVGHTTARSHMRWATAAYERATQKYPEIVRISAPLETGERVETAYSQAKELLAKHPDLEGFEGSSVVDVAGIGRAIREGPAGRRAGASEAGADAHRGRRSPPVSVWAYQATAT